MTGLGGIEAAAHAIRLTQQNRPLTLSCEPTLLMRCLIPRIAAFRHAHPGVPVNLVAGGGPVALGAGVDLAIRRNDFIWPGHYASAHLFDEAIGPVCRPDRADAARTENLPRLHSRTRISAWATWCQLSQQSAIGGLEHSAQSLEFEHFYFSLQAAVAGLGCAIGPWHLVRDDLASGLLTAPFGFLPDGSSYHLLSTSPFAPNSPASQLRDWLREMSGAVPTTSA